MCLRHDLCEQTFLYGGIGAGAVQRVASVKLRTKGTVVATGAASDTTSGGWSKQTFAGFGVYLSTLATDGGVLFALDAE